MTFRPTRPPTVFACVCVCVRISDDQYCRLVACYRTLTLHNKQCVRDTFQTYGNFTFFTIFFLNSEIRRLREQIVIFLYATDYSLYVESTLKTKTSHNLIVALDCLLTIVIKVLKLFFLWKNLKDGNRNETKRKWSVFSHQEGYIWFWKHNSSTFFNMLTRPKFFSSCCCCC